MAVQHNKIFMERPRVERDKYTLSLSNGEFIELLGESESSLNLHKLYISKYVKYVEGNVPELSTLELVGYDEYEWVLGRTYSFYSVENKQEVYTIMIDKTECSYLSPDLYTVIVPAGQELTLTCIDNGTVTAFEASHLSPYHATTFFRHINVLDKETELIEETTPWSQEASLVERGAIDESSPNVYIHEVKSNYRPGFQYVRSYSDKPYYFPQNSSTTSFTGLGMRDSDDSSEKASVPTFEGKRLLNGESVDLTEADILKIQNGINNGSLNLKLKMHLTVQKGSDTSTKVEEIYDVSVDNLRTITQSRKYLPSGTYRDTIYTAGDLKFKNLDTGEDVSCLFGTYSSFNENENRKWPYDVDPDIHLETSIAQRCIGVWNTENVAPSSQISGSNYRWPAAFNSPYDTNASILRNKYWLRPKEEAHPYADGWDGVSLYSSQITLYDDRDCTYGPLYIYSSGRTDGGFCNDSSIFGGVTFKQTCNASNILYPGTIATKTIEFDTYPDKFTKDDIGSTIVHSYSYDENEGYKTSGIYRIRDITSQSAHKIHVVADDTAKATLDRQLGENSTTYYYSYMRWEAKPIIDVEGETLSFTGTQIARCQVYTALSNNYLQTPTRKNLILSTDLTNKVLNINRQVGDCQDVANFNESFYKRSSYNYPATFIVYNNALYYSRRFDITGNTITFYNVRNISGAVFDGTTLRMLNGQNYTSTKRYSGFDDNSARPEAGAGVPTFPNYYYYQIGSGTITTDFLDLHFSSVWDIDDLITAIETNTQLTFENVPTVSTTQYGYIKTDNFKILSDVVAFICLVFGGYFICDDQKLIFKRFNQKDIELTSRDYIKFEKSEDIFNLDSILLNEIGFAAINPQGVCKKITVDALNLNATYPDEVTLASELARLIITLYGQANGTIPGTLTLAEDYDIEVGDIITVDDVQMLVTSKEMDSQKVLLETVKSSL